MSNYSAIIIVETVLYTVSNAYNSTVQSPLTLYLKMTPTKANFYFTKNKKCTKRVQREKWTLNLAQPIPKRYRGTVAVNYVL